MSELTPKQARFVDEYLIDLNATQAAIRAGYSEKTAHVQGPRLLDYAEVRSAIETKRGERSQKTGIDAAWLLERLAEEATADINDIYGPDGELLPVKKWPKIWRQGLITGIDTEEIEVDGVRVGIVRKIKQSDRLRRLELIGKHIGVKAFEETVNIKGLDALADRLARAAQRNG